MVVTALQLDNRISYSSGTITKDKVLSVRVEEGLYNQLEKLTEEWNTGSVSKTVRTLLLYYFLPVLYEEQWKQVNSESFMRFVEIALAEGKEIELQKYKELMEVFSEYLTKIKTIAEGMNSSEQFFISQVELLEQVSEKLEEASILWKGKLFEGKKKTT